VDDETKDDNQPEGGSEGQGQQEGSDDTGQGQEGQGEGAQAPVDPLAALLTPEGRQLVSQTAEEVIAERERERQAQADEEAMLGKPDEEVGKEFKGLLEKQRAARSLMPEVQKGFYQQVVSDLVKNVPELAELTPEERQAILNPNLRSDADVLKALMDVVGEKRAAKLVEAATQKAAADTQAAEAAKGVVQKNEQTVPGLGGGAPAGNASSETTDPSKLVSEFFAENPPPE
jgi:hypothetical protein